MGYYSDFHGAFKLSKHPRGVTRVAIKSEIEKVFGKYAMGQSNINYEGDVFYNPDKHTVEPVDLNMKGYDFVAHTKTIAHILQSFGISLKGEVFRHGEECDDHVRYFFKKGKLYWADGQVVYKNPKEA